MQEISIQEALDNLSSKRHVISEEAIRAKASLESQSVSPQLLSNQLSLMAEFGKSVNLLRQVFHQSRLDDLVILMSNPLRLFLLNLCMGFVWGIGFLVGALVVVLLFLATFKGFLSPEIVKQLLS